MTDINEIINTFCGNNNKYIEIKDWILDLYKKNNQYISVESCIFISGNNGIGKTYNIKKICELLNLFIVNIDSYNCNTSDKITDLIYKTINSSLVQILTNNTSKKILIIDEIDTLLSFDRTISISLLNILLAKKLKNIPIICICTPDILKKIGDIKKRCKILELSLPSDDDILMLLKNVNINKKKICDLKSIARNANGNISQALKNYESFENFYNIDKIYNIEHLYSNKFDRNIFKEIILSDPWLVPLRFHENLLIELNTKRICTDKKRKELYKSFTKMICYFDLLMYKNIIEIAVDYFICIIYELTKLPLKKNTESTMTNFTKILSYLSLQKKYLKQSYSMNFPLYQIGNYHINNISRNFIYFN
jgi:nucleoside-triphosphatase THEP1